MAGEGDSRDTQETILNAHPVLASITLRNATRTLFQVHVNAVDFN